jgi:phosphoenolpyruvate carboxykinase (GTP)
MDMNKFLEERLSGNAGKLAFLKNPKVEEFISEFVEHCNPDSVFICDNSQRDVQYVRDMALRTAEEAKLSAAGHTVHFDGYTDQGRDPKCTRYLLPEGVDLGELKGIPRQEGLQEVRGYLKDSMVGKEMLVLFFTLGPEDSKFSIPCVQITDSYYVAHSEMILYRPGYNNFRKLGKSGAFFRFVHTAGEQEHGVSKNTDLRRVYIDLKDNVVYSTNTQYGGNTIGLKKLAMRLAIQKACGEDWLTEHMFIMGVHGPGGRTTYLAGAYPSACGKTSTSMMKGETIVGDDIAYLRIMRGEVRAVNVEKGLFGIIADVNSKDDPVIYKALTTPREVIFSNVLVDEKGVPYWVGKDGDCPPKGRNHSGDWFRGKRDVEDKEIPPSHKNARYTIGINELENKDPKADDPAGVRIDGVIYGGRDSDTTVPVEEAFDWKHGILTKAATIESETTAATLGQEGVRSFNPMSNLDFLSVPLGKYIRCNLDFGSRAKRQPKVFSVNYFIRGKDGKFLTNKDDKRVWVKWMDLRVNGEVDAIKTPTGYIPLYEDLRRLFKEVLWLDYSKAQYDEQFKIRVLEHLAKLDRIEVIYRQKVPDAPKELFRTLDQQRKRLEEVRARHGDYILPEQLL